MAVEYRRKGGSSTGAGREDGLALARMYLADTGHRSDAGTILEEITAAIPRNTAGLSRADRVVFAAAAMLYANYLRDTGDTNGASAAFLSAGTLFAPVDGERAAEALYGAADAFMRSGKRGDAKKALETLRSSWPESLWTRRAGQLLPSD